MQSLRSAFLPLGGTFLRGLGVSPAGSSRLGLGLAAPASGLRGFSKSSTRLGLESSFRPRRVQRPLAQHAQALRSPFPVSAGAHGRTFSTTARRTARQGGRFQQAFASPHGALDADAPTSIAQPGGWARVLTSLGIIGGTAYAANLFFNRETRAPLQLFEREYLNSTFRYLAGGLTMTAITAVGLHRIGFSRTVMMANPWVVLGVGLLGSIGGMIGTLSISPENRMSKFASWALFNFSQGAVLSPLLFFSPAILARAGLYTAGIMGALCYIGATARDGQYLWLGGPLLAGVTVVALSSLAPLVLPMTAFRALAVTEAVTLYGGLAVFGGFILFDTQKVLRDAGLVASGQMKADPMAESVGLELDFINIFVRMVQILASREGNKRR